MDIVLQLKEKIETILGETVALGRIREGYNVAIRDENVGEITQYLNKSLERNKTYIIFSQDYSETVARQKLLDLLDGLYGLSKDDFDTTDLCVNFVEATDPFFVDYTQNNKIIYGMNLNLRLDKNY